MIPKIDLDWSAWIKGDNAIDVLICVNLCWSLRYSCMNVALTCPTQSIRNLRALTPGVSDRVKHLHWTHAVLREELLLPFVTQFRVPSLISEQWYVVNKCYIRFIHNKEMYLSWIGKIGWTHLWHRFCLCALHIQPILWPQTWEVTPSTHRWLGHTWNK